MTVILDASLHRGAAGPPVVVVPRGVTRGRLRRPPAWRDVRTDDAVAAIAGAPVSALVLVRSPDADPGAAQVARCARAVGRTVLILPEPADLAVAVCGLAIAWCVDGVPRHAEAVAALVSAAQQGDDLVALGPRVLARWAARAWLPCTACAPPGGGVPGRPCARCGTRLPSAGAARLAPVVPLRRSA